MRHTLGLGLVVLLAGCGQKPATMAHYKPVSHWIKALGSPDAKTRQQAVTILGNVGPADRAVLPALTGAVKDRDAAVRAEAVLALLKMGPRAKDAVAALTEATQDDDPKVRSYAAKALEVIEK
jgi:HEAT repeat protein